MDPSTRKKLIIGLVVVGLVGLVAILVVATSRSSAPKCGLSQSGPPNQDPSKSPNKASLSDKSGLVHAVAYLIILDQPAGFIPLSLEDVNTTRYQSHGMFTNLDLNYDCAHMNFSVELLNDEYVFRSLNVSINQEGKFVPYCRAQIENLNSWKSKEYYSCQGQQVLNCVSAEKDARGNIYDKTRANIVFNSLEVELDADSAKHAKGEFSQKPFLTSCPDSRKPDPITTTTTKPTTSTTTTTTPAPKSSSAPQPTTDASTQKP